MSLESHVTVWASLLFSKVPSNTTWWPSISKASDSSIMTRTLAPVLSFLYLPKKLVEDQGLIMVEYGAQKATLHLSNAT